MLLKDWSNMVLLPKTKICQAPAWQTHFCHTRKSSLQQNQPQEAGRQSLLNPKSRCSHLDENSSTISFVWWKRVDFRKYFSKKVLTFLSQKNSNELAVGHRQRWVGFQGLFRRCVTLQKSHQLDKDERLELLDYIPGRQIRTSQLQLLSSLDKMCMNAHLGKKSSYQAFQLASHYIPKDTTNK